MKHTAQTFMEATLKASRLDPKQAVFVMNVWTSLNHWQIALGQGYELDKHERRTIETLIHKAGVAYTRVLRENPTAVTADIRFNCQIAMKSLEAIVAKKTNQKRN